MKSHNCSVKLLVSILTLGVVLSGAPALAQDIDDIETDMETALSESEAAQSEAKAAKNREREEQILTEKTKQEANRAMETAKVKEAQAKQEIKKIEARIAALNVERKKFEKLKIAADQKIVTVTEKLNGKKTNLSEAQAQHAAALEEKKQREEVLAKLREEQKQVENEIIKNKQEIVAYSQDIKNLQKKEKDLEMKLEVLRKNAFVEAQKVENIKKQKSEQLRKVSSIPTRVIMRSPKVVCDVLDAAGDGATPIGKLKKGHKYEIYRVVDKRWVYLQFGKIRAYSARTCF